MTFLFLHRMVYQEPLGILYLAAALARAGHQVHFIDLSLERDWLSRVEQLRPDVIGYSVVTGSQQYFLTVNAQLKKRLQFLSLWGGPHPTFFPEFLEEEGVDALCVGEGEGAVVELAETLARGGDITAIPNLHLKTSAGVVRNAPRPLCQDLDQLPLPERRLLRRYSQYRCMSGRAVMTSRGCPFRCRFCYNAQLRELYRGCGPFVRRRSLDGIIAECRELRRDPWVRQIAFKDDLFAQDPDFVREFARRYRAEVGLPFSCNVRADRMTEQMADDLAHAGARVVHFGVESGNDRIRREVLGRPVTREAMRCTAQWLRARGVRVYAFNIVGVPGESPDEAFETLRFNAELGVDLAVFTLFQPYPRTPLGDEAVKRGWAAPGYEDFAASYYTNSMRRLPHLRQFENMVRLFPLAVSWPLFRRLTPGLVHLPLGPLYAGLDFVFKSTRFVFRLGLVTPTDIAVFSGHYTPPADVAG